MSLSKVEGRLIARLGDKVACSCKGGPHRIVSGSPTTMLRGIPVARVGDKSSCGASIVSGTSRFMIRGAQAALDGSQTSCGGTVVVSAGTMTGNPSSAATGQALSAAAALAGVGTVANRASPPQQPVRPSPGRDDDEAHSDTAPGFIIVRKLTPRADLKRELLPAPTPEVDAMFERLNGHLGDLVLPGSMVVLSDPDNLQCRPEEDQLMQEARQVQNTVQRLEPAQAQAMIDHWGAFEDIALAKAAEDDISGSSLSSASTVLGTFSAAGQNLFGKARFELDNLANLYQRTLDPTVRQSRAQFHALREAAFQRIDSAVPAWLRRPLSLPVSGEALKRRIGIEASQAVHGLRTATEGFRQFEIPSVSEAITRVGLASKLTSIGSAVGVGLDTYATRSSIAEACSTGREEECRRIRYIEYGRLAGRTFGGGAGAIAAPSSGVCMVVSLNPGGKVICGVVAAGTGAYGGAKVAEPFGERAGLFFYQALHSDKNDDNR